MQQPTAASQYLLSLARHNAQAYAALPGIRAIIVTGSVAQGLSDTYSDIDMIVYYDALPSEEQLLEASQTNNGINRRQLAERGEDECMEAYYVNGVQCQVASTTIAAWERDMAVVLEQLDVTTPLQKALSGMLDAIPLYGDSLIRQWQAKLAHYPDTLADAMVKHYLTFFPMWAVRDQIAARDATVWTYQILTETAQHLLGVLAGLNRVYYSSFQFKRMYHFVEKLKLLPTDFEGRLNAIFHVEPLDAAQQVESLVSETVTLVEQHMPHIDTTAVRRALAFRQQPWQLPSERV